MNILDTILSERRADVDASRAEISEQELRRQAEGREHHSLISRLAACDRPGLIAETKKASPSAGVLKENYNPGELAAAYESAGAVGISVLTEPRHFLGTADHLREVRKVVSLPVLRKDFMCVPYQVYEAAAWGADVVLLIVAALSDEQLHVMNEAAMSCGLEVLAESHTEDELSRALSLDNAIIGVNNRDLKTLNTDLAVSKSMAQSIPADRVSISESGIRTKQDVDVLFRLGYNGALIGHALLEAGEPGLILRGLVGK